MRARIAQIAFTLTLVAGAVLAAPDRAHSATGPATFRPAWTTSAPAAAGRR